MNAKVNSKKTLTVFNHRSENPDIKEKNCAVLVDYIWDQENSFVKKNDKIIKNITYLIKQEKQESNK